jgi:RimJ/RimL family protein N-acetyltransferase
LWRRVVPSLREAIGSSLLLVTQQLAVEPNEKRDESHAMCVLEMLRTQVETLFILGGNGRLARVNADEKTPVPRFFFGSTLGGNLWRFRRDMPGNTVAELESLCMQEPVCADLRDAPQHLEAYKRILNAHEKITHSWSGPAYWIPAEDLPPSAAATRIDRTNVHLLRESFPDVERKLDSSDPVFVVVADNKAVSICLSARIGSRAHEAGVETLEPYRGRGYASIVTTAWAAAVHRLGRIPFYSTSWENVASHGVARRLGARLFGADLHFT